MFKIYNYTVNCSEIRKDSLDVETTFRITSTPIKDIDHANKIAKAVLGDEWRVTEYVNTFEIIPPRSVIHIDTGDMKIEKVNEILKKIKKEVAP